MKKSSKHKKNTNTEDKNITNVESFISKIKEVKAFGNIFYRGHSNETYELEPSIYRKEKDTGHLPYIENEDKIYRETIAKVPYDFNGKNTIESLVLMQHYGVPTRILDLTTNPLVALYFACEDKNKEVDGEVIVFDIPQESTCYFDSDRVSVLANLAKCKSVFYYRDGNMPKYKDYKSKLKTIKEKSKIQSFDTNLWKTVGNIEDYSLKEDFFLYPNEIETFIEAIINGNNFQSYSDEKKKTLKYILLEKLENKVNSLEVIQKV